MATGGAIVSCRGCVYDVYGPGEGDLLFLQGIREDLMARSEASDQENSMIAWARLWGRIDHRRTSDVDRVRVPLRKNPLGGGGVGGSGDWVNMENQLRMR